MIKFLDFIINDFDSLSDFDKMAVFNLIMLKWKIYKKELPDKI